MYIGSVHAARQKNKGKTSQLSHYVLYKTGHYSNIYIFMIRPTDNLPVSYQTPLNGGLCLLKNRLSLPQYHCTGSTWIP